MAKRITAGPTPQIVIENVKGDLRLVGWENEEILSRADDEDGFNIQQDENTFTITCQDDLSLTIPKGANVNIQTVDGDMSVRGLTADFVVDVINGDVAIRDVGNVSIGTVESDFSLRSAKGNVHVKSVGGDASLRGVDGNLALDSVSDDLAIRGVGGNLKVDVDEDVVVHLDPKPDQDYSVVAGDDIMLVLPDNVNATLTLSGDDISVNFPDVESVKKEVTNHEVVLGDGSAKISLSAGGDVLVTSRLDAADSAEEYGNFAGMMFDWGNWGREIGENWGNIGRDIGEKASRRAQEVAERAARKAEAAARRAERRAEETARRMERDVEKHLRHKPHVRGKVEVGRWKWDFPPVPPVKPNEPVSDEERMTILRMLAEKKISAEEAEKLLSALEGGK